MSDPVSNAEIEDVLSSIRRLVSEDTSPLHRRKQIAEGAKERFVLTPALRVSEDDDVEADQQAEAAEAEDVVVGLDTDEHQDVQHAADAMPVDDATVDKTAESQLEEGAVTPTSDRFAQSRQTLEQRIAELEAALQQSAEEWEPDGSEVVGNAAPNMPSIADAPEPSEPDSDIEIEASDTEAAALLEISEPDLPEIEDAASEGLDKPFDETGSTICGPDFEVDEEVAEVEEDAPEVLVEASAPFMTSDLQEKHEESASQVPEEDGTVLDAEPSDGVINPDSAMSEDALVGDATQVETEDDPNPALDEVLDHAGPLEADSTEPQDEEQTEHFELFEDSAVLDEDALRDIVSQLVRDELQGVLGERITRNVRRLVRREIQRAMAMRDLE